MPAARLAERALLAPSRDSLDYSITEVSFILHDLSWTDGPSTDQDKLENEVLVDPWSSMDSTNSPLTDSVPSASDDCTPSTSNDNHISTPLSHDAPPPTQEKPKLPKDKARNLTLDLDIEPLPRRHFLDDEFPTKSNIECRIPKPHFLDHSPSPDEFDERSDITNPNFLDYDDDDAKKGGALPKKPSKPLDSDKPRTSYRTALYGLDAARSSERDKRASQLFRGTTWPGDWNVHDTASVRSFSSNGSADHPRPSSNLENKMECVCSLISLLSLSPENNADLSGPLLEMSRSVESCIAMRQAGCIPLLVQLIHSKVARETRDRAAKALRNIIHTQTDDKAGRREARVWRLLEQVREYCHTLEDVVKAREDGKEVIEDDNTKHPSQSVAALMKLSFDEEHRHVVCQLGGLQALAALVSGDQAAHGSGTDDSTCLTMRKYAGMTLTNLTFGDGNNKSLLCSFKEFMMALVEQLESPNDDMKQVTAAVLRNLSWRADTNSKQVLREVGAVKGLTKAAMTCQKEATLKSVLSALWNLTAHCSMNKVALCSVDGALGFLVDMLSYDSPTKTLAIVENAGGIMRNVSSHIAVREDYRQILRERNCLSVLLQHLKSPSLTVVSNSCGTLWNLSARCPQDQQFLWDHGAVPMLRSLIHSKHKMIAMGSSAALKNLLNSKPGKTHIISLDATARSMNLPALPTLGARKQKSLEQELDQNLAETCDNIEPVTSPTTSNREEKNLFTATERQIAMNLERHRMTASSPLMGALTSQMSLSHGAHLASYLGNTLLKGTLSHSAGGSSNNVNRSDSKDSVTSTHSDSVFERAMRTGKVPVPTPRNKQLMKDGSEALKVPAKKDGFLRYPSQPPIPPPRTTDMRTNYTESGYDVDQDSCDQPIDYSQKYSETKGEAEPTEQKAKEPKKFAKKESSTFGDYQETDLDQPTDYSIRYAEHQSETGSDTSEPPGPSINEDTIKHFATEGTPYETPVIFSTATSMSDLRVIGKPAPKPQTPQVKENPEQMTRSDEKDTCSIEDPPHDNDRGAPDPVVEKPSLFDTKFSSGMISPEKPVNYCDEGTPGYFSRVSSLSSLGEPTEEDCLAKKNAMATINVGASPLDLTTSSNKDKEGSKAVTFATDPPTQPPSGAASARTCSPQRFVEDTPLMFSRSSSLGSLPECSHDDQGSVVSEVSRLTSGCISPSEIPDSPGASAPLSPRARHPPQGRSTGPSTPPPEANPSASVFAERVSRFVVEDTPAQFSTATSLSSLTIDDEPRGAGGDGAKAGGAGTRPEIPPLPVGSTPIKGSQTPAEVCQVYFTEDTPAILSKAGSNSNLSALSIDSAPVRDGPVLERDGNLSDVAERLSDVRDTSDSSNLSDAGDLLEECIQKGIAKVVKNKGQPSDVSINPFRDEFYRSLPPYLRSSTETVRQMARGRSPSAGAEARGSPPPPLPPKTSHHVAPPRPPPFEDHHNDGRKHESRLPVKTQRQKPRLPATADLARNDSLSSLSLDSFGSTDREIFEETVQAGLSSGHPRASSKAHSVERPCEATRHGRHHKSLDRSDKIGQHRPKRDADFEKNPGVYPKPKKDQGTSLTRSPFSYHGDTGFSFSHHSKGGQSSRYLDDGPPSLPARVDDRRQYERSNSLSSLSNDSFGSTDKEVFERCVKMGMSKAQKKDAKIRVRSDDRLEMRGRHDDRMEVRESRRRRKDVGHVKPPQGALDKMVGEEYSKDRAILEEVIARGAGERIEKGSERDRSNSKNVPEPSVARAAAGELANTARSTPTGSETPHHRPTPPDHLEQCHDTTDLHCDSALESEEPGDETGHESSNSNLNDTEESVTIFERSNEMPTVDSGNTTFESAADLADMDRSNECLAVKSINTTIESEIKDELNRSNESYADVLDGSFSDGDVKNYEVATLTRKKNTLEWTDIRCSEKPIEDLSKRSIDTWNDNTCPDDVTFPTISGSCHMVSSIRSEVVDPGMALPDLLEKSDPGNRSFSKPDLTNKLEQSGMSQKLQMTTSIKLDSESLLENISEPSFTLMAGESEHKFDSIMSSAIEKEAARLAAQLKSSHYTMETSVNSLASLDLDNVRPPSNLGSLSLSASGHWDDTAHQPKRPKSRKKSLPVALMVKRALGHSLYQGSNENLDSNPVSFLDNVKPPSEMEHLDMESSMISVSSIASEVAETKRITPVVFDFRQPIQDFPMCNNFTVFHDLDNVNPPSLFDEIAESTVVDQTTAQNVYEDCVSTLNVVTDIPSGSENCTPLPSDASSVESTPKKRGYLTPKEKRYVSKDRYQTYTITDSVTEDDVVLQVHTEEFMTWTKSESDKSDDYITASSEPKVRRKLSAKQRRVEDRARYQTQTVDIQNILQESSESNFEVETLKQRLAAKKTLKQKRVEDAERFRTRTLSEDIPPSPTFVTKDANFENVETTTGYDSLSSNELNHQQILDDRNRDDDVFSRETDSGHNDDDHDDLTTQMLTYTTSYKNYLPIVEGPSTFDMCTVKNLKNIEMTASYRRTMEQKSHPSSDFASYEADMHSESDSEMPQARPKPKITKPGRRDDSLDSNDSQGDQDGPKSVRGRRKAVYVSPYRRNVPAKTATPPAKIIPRASTTRGFPAKAQSAKLPNRSAAKPSPKNTPNKSTTKPALQKPAIPVMAAKPLPLERQGTFTKEESSVSPKNLPASAKANLSRVPKGAPTKPVANNTSPSRLPQLSRYSRTPLTKANSKPAKPSPSYSKRPSLGSIKNSASNQSLQSNDSGKTITLTRGSRQGSSSSVNSQSSKTNTRDVESKIASLWKRVEQSKRVTNKPDRRVWIESDKAEPVETPKLIRSSTFEGQPKLSQVPAPKQKSAIGMRVSQIPSLRPKSTPGKIAQHPQPSGSGKKPVTTRVFARKPVNGQFGS